MAIVTIVEMLLPRFLCDLELHRDRNDRILKHSLLKPQIFTNGSEFLRELAAIVTV